MKHRLRDLLYQRDLEEISSAAAVQKRVFSTLIALTYDDDRLVAWRAVEAMGRAAERVARDDADFIRGLLRRLHWSLSEESGGVGWYAPQAMAEIVRGAPGVLSSFASIVVTLLVTMAEEDLSHFRPGILWAIGRLAPIASDDVEAVVTQILESLDDPDPQVRGMAVWCLRRTGREHLLAGRAHLLADGGVVEIYENGRLRRTDVAELARG